MVARTTAILRSKGIAYRDLKNALVPQHDRSEMALVFDISEMSETWYGLPIHRRLIPLLHRKSSRRILCGDYIGGNHNQDALYQALVEGLVLARDVNFRHSSLFYIVYINNLTSTMMSEIDAGFREYPYYSGYIDTTYSSKFKLYVSATLVNVYLQHRDFIICGHEDDRADDDNVNISGYPFEEYGFKIRSLPSNLEGVLLSYKIERPVFPGSEVDTEFSLNAVHTEPMPLEDFEIIVDERKFEYLTREKAESLRGLGLLGSDAADLKKIIREKITSNYIYGMSYDDDHAFTGFNLILEVRRPESTPFRVLVGLKYVPSQKQLHLVTLF